LDARNSCLVKEIAIANVVDLVFSPRETYIVILAKYEKPAPDAMDSRNLFVVNAKSGEKLADFTQKNTDVGCNVQWVENESLFAMQAANEVQFYDTEKLKIVDRLKKDGITSFSLSPGKRPIVAVFIAEKNVPFCNLGISCVCHTV
jgi:translation initiation factor 2A